MNRLPGFFVLAALLACGNENRPALAAHPAVIEEKTAFEKIGAIPPPEGYTRVAAADGSFGAWLRTVKLKQDDRVYLYDGTLKRRQSAQFAVLDIPVGEKDLQQCADAVMRLRAEYLLSEERYTEIAFRDNNNKWYKWTGTNDRAAFERYLEQVFGWCGTASLEKQLRPVVSLQTIQPGDVFIHGGFPGHAMIVADVAVNKEGRKAYMLAQSYMPAQDIHVVRNPADDRLSPWYEVDAASDIDTPEWTFVPGELKRW